MAKNRTKPMAEDVNELIALISASYDQEEKRDREKAAKREAARARLDSLLYTALTKETMSLASATEHLNTTIKNASTSSGRLSLMSVAISGIVAIAAVFGVLPEFESEPKGIRATVVDLSYENGKLVAPVLFENPGEETVVLLGAGFSYGAEAAIAGKELGKTLGRGGELPRAETLSPRETTMPRLEEELSSDDLVGLLAEDGSPVKIFVQVHVALLMPDGSEAAPFVTAGALRASLSEIRLEETTRVNFIIEGSR